MEAGRKAPCRADEHVWCGMMAPTKTLARQSEADRLLQYIIQLSVLALWKSFATISAPFSRVFAFYFWLGRSGLKLCAWLQRTALKLVAWFGSPAFERSPWLKHWSRSYIPVDVRRWHLALGVFVTVSLIQSLARKWQESFDERLRKVRDCRARMKAATCYAEWREFACQLERLEQHAEQDPSREWRYDKRLLKQKLEHLQKVRDMGNVKEMMFALRTDLMRNVANIAKCDLHEAYCDVPPDINEYIQEVKEQLHMLADWPEVGVAAEDKLNFFRETRHTYGRTALLLSGGGGLGSFHIGVVKALFEHRMLPRVVAGSSVGSIIAGIVATRTDVELHEVLSRLQHFELAFFNHSRAVELAHHFIHKGHMQDMDFLVRKLRELLGEMTFLEAYERTGRILNVTVCPADTNEPARMLNYLTAPHALIWSAVAASSAFPGLFPAQHLMARNTRGEIVRFAAPPAYESLERRWRDGSLELDLPTFLLAEMFNCNHFLVSQTNPHIVPLLNIKRAMSRGWANLFELEIKHRAAQAQWLLPSWVPSKWFSLFTQPWEGDITFVLPAALWHMGKAVVNPTTEDLMLASRHGELAVWERLSAIQANCAVEATLDACLARITNKVRERPLGSLGSRIPSWLHMSHIGAPAVASWGVELGGGGGGGGSSSAAAAAAAASTSRGMHEVVPDDRPRRVASWGSVDIADSVSDFPAAVARGGGAGSVLGGGGGGRSGGAGACADGGGSEDGGSVVSGGAASAASASSGAAPDARVMAQLDCCDSSAFNDIWSSLLPLAWACDIAAPASVEGEGLDFIAP